MLQAKLSPCASLLYQWVLMRVPTDDKLKIDLQDFQAWTGEFREKCYSYAEVFEAFVQLKDLKLINVSKTEVTLEAKIAQQIPLFAPTELISATPKQPPTPNRWLTLAKILIVSSILTVGSVSIGLQLWQMQPEVAPHPWSVLGKD